MIKIDSKGIQLAAEELYTNGLLILRGASDPYLTLPNLKLAYKDVEIRCVRGLCDKIEQAPFFWQF